MSNLQWKYRTHPGSSRVHLWKPGELRSLCGKMKLSEGYWKEGLHPSKSKCSLCKRRQDAAEETLRMVLGVEQEKLQQWEKQRRDFVLTEDSRIKALAMIRAHMALLPEPFTRETALGAVLALAVMAVETDVTWTQLHDALRTEYDRLSAVRKKAP